MTARIFWIELKNPFIYSSNLNFGKASTVSVFVSSSCLTFDFFTPRKITIPTNRIASNSQRKTIMNRSLQINNDRIRIYEEELVFFNVKIIKIIYSFITKSLPKNVKKVQLFFNPSALLLINLKRIKKYGEYIFNKFQTICWYTLINGGDSFG
jgi:hypothetical protein